LKWFLEVEDHEPNRYAVLKDHSQSSVLHREPFYSLNNKLIEIFRDEFVSSALHYQRI